MRKGNILVIIFSYILKFTGIIMLVIGLFCFVLLLLDKIKTQNYINNGFEVDVIVTEIDKDKNIVYGKFTHKEKTYDNIVINANNVIVGDHVTGYIMLNNPENVVINRYLYLRDDTKLGSWRYTIPLGMLLVVGGIITDRRFIYV